MATKRALSFSVLIAAAVVFGMVVAGAVNVTPRSDAQRDVPGSAANTSSTTGTTTARARSGAVALPSFADIADEAMPSVVSITSTDIVKGSNRRNPLGGNEGDPFEFFFGPRRNQQRGGGEEEEHKEVQGGTGFVISEDGYIVTNNHVVENATRVDVRLQKQTYSAKIVGRDTATDLALLKIDAKRKLTAIPLGDSDKVRVGEWVMAIGDPLTFDKTVTVGVVSAKERSGLTADAATRSFENFIQTDAAINFGNSGGPLINVNGEVIGINTAMFRPAQNIGFAVPINTLKQVLPQLRDKGKVTRGYLGINIRNVDTDHAAAFRLKGTEGAFVESVIENEPADKAGIKPGDTIVRVDSVDVKETRDLIGYVSAKSPGTKVKLTIVRDGKEMPVTVSLAERGGESSSDSDREAKGGDDSRGKIGISVQGLTPEVRRMAGVEPSTEGLFVAHVKEVSPAADAGLREGDVITQVNGRPISSTEEFGRLVKNAGKGEYLRLYVLRPQAKVSFFALVKIGD